MNFLSKHTDGTLRLLFSFIAIYCLTITSIVFIRTMFTDKMTSDDCLWIQEKDGKKLNEGLYIVEVLPGGVTDAAGIKNGDILIAINGIKFESINKAQEILNSFEDEEVIEYTVIRDNEILKFNIKVIKFFNILFLIFSLLGFGFLVIGFLVGYSKPKELTSQLFFFLGCTASLLFVQVGFINTGISNYLSVFNSIVGSFFYALFVHFIITYPIKIEHKYRKLFLAILYISIFTFVIIRILTYGSNISFVMNLLASIFAVFSIASGIYFLIRSYLRLNDSNLKKPMKVILIGFLLGAVGFTYSLIISVLVKTPNFLLQPWIFLPTALVLFIPVSIGFSIFKYRILDTEFIVKKGLVFGIITAFIVGIYLLLVFVLNSLLSQFLPENKQLLTIALIIVVTFSFDYVNKRAKDFVDKQFYRERYNYRKSLLLFSEELPYLDNVRKIIEKIGSSVKETMGIDNLNVWFKDQEFHQILQNDFEKVSENERLIYKDDSYDEAFSSLFIRNKEPRLINEVLLQELKISDEYKEIILREKFALLIPIFIKDVLIGTMNFGEKPSGKAYSDEDIDLLKTLASQAAIAFENSRLQKEKVLKQVMEEELQIARNIQMGLLPQSINSIDGIEVSGFYNPAKIIGGDFYDVIKLSESKMLVIVADVSGKGIAAALYMSKVQAMIQFAAKLFQSPKDILIEVNKQIHNKIDKKSFITTVVALFDLEKMKVKICRAGHNPVIYSVNGKFDLLKNKGMGLGLESEVFFNQNLEETELDITDDNVFVFYSDGLTEAMNRNREEFGTDKVMDIISLNRQNSCSLIQKEIINSVDNFRGSAEQNDDITLVITKIKSIKNNNKLSE
ncbi:MAG TPA: SpoIIE family protein phosphatase [Ignavibacteria bacterium]|nr:SpoIIE family protein phosphatase [Ignavibacteria bacterium]HMR39948.1 SpoIIE family protein phosphatase [Ignavibacteria bacterium]